MKWLDKLLGKNEPEAAATPTVTARLRREAGNIYVLKVGGVLNKATMDNIQAVAKRDFESGVESIKMLIILDDFRGWKSKDNWGDMDFMLQYGSRISKMAVLGDLKWKEETMAFVGAGHRQTEVKCFPPGSEPMARAWLTK